MTPARRVGLRALEVLSILELVSIVVLVINLVTVHARPVTAVVGPTHGVLFMAVAVVALVTPQLRWSTRLLTLIPVSGGVFCLVNVRAERRRTSELQQGALPAPEATSGPASRSENPMT